MRTLIDIVRQSLATLWAHKLRSFLTMFGIAWGVSSLLLLVGLGEGFRSGQARQLSNLGQDIMFSSPGASRLWREAINPGLLITSPTRTISLFEARPSCCARCPRCLNETTFAP